MDKLLTSESLLKQSLDNQEATENALDEKRFNLFDKIFLTTILVIIGSGWAYSDYLSYSSAVTYQLGVGGAALLICAAVYSIIRVLKVSRTVTTSRWFRAHMVLGGSGTVVILFHSKFQLGTLHQVMGDFALATLITLAVCGLIGQLVYANLKYGLLGKHETVESLRKKLAFSQKNTEEFWHCSFEEMMQPIKRIEQILVKLAENYYAGILVLLFLPFAVLFMRLWCKYYVSKYVKHEVAGYMPQEAGGMVTRKMLALHVNKYLNYSIKIVEYTLSQRLFSLWRTLYATLFLLSSAFIGLHFYNVAI